MRFSLDADPNRYSIRNYGSGWITVNDQNIRRSVIITPERLVLDWPPQTFAELDETYLAMILTLEPEIVLLGTGRRQQFPHPRLTQALLAQGIGVEVMDTAAACRTYNVIMLEGRRVAAALLLIAD